MAEALADYIADAEAGHGRSKPLKPYTLQEYRRLLDGHLKPYQDLAVAELTGREIDRIRRSHSPSVANGIIRLLRAACNHAFARDVIRLNPFAGRRRIVAPLPPRTDHVPETAIGRLLLALDDLQAPSVRAGEQVAGDALMLMVLYGLRKVEAMSLPISAVDLRAGLFRVESNKSDRPLTLPITSVARPLLERRLEFAQILGSGFVFPTVGNRRSRQGWLAEPRRAIRLVSAKTGISFTPHSLRRTFVSFAVRKVPVTIVKAIVNHAATEHGDVTLTHYVRTSCDDMRHPLEELHQAFVGLKAAAAGLKISERRAAEAVA